jgi:predicted DsbA family dithiol-disulfide isomerase
MANNKKTIVPIIVLILLGGLMYGITHFTGGTPPPPPPPAPKPDFLAKHWPEIVSHAAAPPRGNPNAPYTIAEFGDFQCPQCGKARPIIEKMLAQYPDQVNLIFIHRPFPTIHEWAIPAAEASEVAAAQGKFWQMYDILYSHQDDLEPGYYAGYATQLGMNKDQFDIAMNTPATKQEVKTASDFSDSMGVEETPTLVVHDNVHGAVAIYVGLKPTDPAKVKAEDRYIDRDFSVHPPWLTARSSAVGMTPKK